MFIAPQNTAALDGGRLLAAGLMQAPVSNALFTFLVLLVLSGLTFIMRRSWIAVLVLTALPAANSIAVSAAPTLETPFIVASNLLFFAVILRVGLLAHLTVLTVLTMAELAVLTLQPSAWYAPAGWLVMGIVMALAIYGFRTSLGARPLFRAAVLVD